MKNKKLEIIQHLRQNSREKLTQMSRKTSIPVSTIFEYLKSFENDIIKKHTCLIDFKELGFDLRVTMLIQSNQETKQDLQKFLLGHTQVNTVYRINNGYDFFAEVLFRNMNELQVFLDELDTRGIKKRKEHYVLDEIRKEAFLTDKTHIAVLNTAKI